MKSKTFFKAIAILVSINKVVAQLTNIITPSAVVSGSINQINSDSGWPNAVDRDGATWFYANLSTRVVGNSLQVDLGSY